MKAVTFGLLFTLWLCGSASAELHVGWGDVRTSTAWDFSDSAEVGIEVGDLGLLMFAKESYLSAPMDAIFVGLGSARIAISDSPYESLTEAPADSSLYVEFIHFTTDEAYVIRTREGHYAKFNLPVVPGPGFFEYTYQDDGSRILAGPVAVDETTWGRIKALYREGVP